MFSYICIFLFKTQIIIFKEKELTFIYAMKKKKSFAALVELQHPLGLLC